jgi:hypothetical protein
MSIERLSELALARIVAISGLAGESLQQRSLMPFGLEAGYFHLPLDQALEWRIEPDDWLWRLGAAMVIGHWHFALHNELVDEGRLSPGEAVAADVCLLALISELRALSSEVDYAQHYLGYYARYSVAIQSDLARRHRLERYSANEIRQLGAKATTTLVGMEIVADRAGLSDFAPSIVEATSYLCAAIQLHDDLADAEEDFAAGILTYPITLTLTRALGVREGSFDKTGVEWPDIEEALYLSGIAATTMELAYLLAGFASAQARSSGALAVAATAGALAVDSKRRADLLEAGRQEAVGQMLRKR